MYVASLSALALGLIGLALGLGVFASFEPVEQGGGAELSAAKRMVLGEWSFHESDMMWELHDSSELSVRHDGSVHYVFLAGWRSSAVGREPGTRYEVRFQLTPDELERVHEALADSGFFSLASSYSNDALADGAIADYTLTNNGRVHEVHCANRFPRSIRAIVDVLERDVRAPDRAELENARRVVVTPDSAVGGDGVEESPL